MIYLEHAQYEARPYLYSLIALYSYSNGAHSKVILTSALVLGFCALFVFKSRYDYRKMNKDRRGHS